MDFGNNNDLRGIFKRPIYEEELSVEEDVNQDEFVFEKNGDCQGGLDQEEIVEEQAPKQKKSKKQTEKEEKLIHSKTVKFTETENNYLQDLKDVLNTDKDTKAIRYCVDLIIEYHGDEINALAKKKRKAGTINTFK